MHSSSTTAPLRVAAKSAVLTAGCESMEPRPYAMVNMYLGASMEMSCRRGKSWYRGRGVPGDLDIVPANTACNWEAKQSGPMLFMQVPTDLLGTVAQDMEWSSGHVELADRFLLRDPQLEHIGWALKAELDAGNPSGLLFREALGVALCTRMLQRHGRQSLPARRTSGMSKIKLRRVVGYIEDHLAGELALTDLAAVAGLGLSHFKSQFRHAMGLPVHQYVLRRRVAAAHCLLKAGTLSIAAVASATGFAHHSHLARHTRRILGATPQAIRASAC